MPNGEENKNKNKQSRRKRQKRQRFLRTNDMFGSYHRETIVNDLSSDARIFDSLFFSVISQISKATKSFGHCLYLWSFDTASLIYNSSAKAIMNFFLLFDRLFWLRDE